jgi:hypothetical protein
MSRPRLWRRVCAIGGEPLLAVYSDRSDALDALVLGYIESPETRSPRALEIFLLGGALAEKVGIEQHGPVETIYADDTVSICSEGGRHYGNWYGKAASVADPRAGRAIICAPGLRRYHPDFISRFVFRPVLDRLLFDHGWLPLHAAAVSGGGKGCLLVGGTGAGKTTLLLRLLEEGMGFLADDRALVRREGDRFRIHFSPERIRRMISPQERKSALAAPESAIHSAEAGMLLFLDSGADGEARAEHIGVAEASARLARAVSPYMTPGERCEMLESIERLCRVAVRCVIRGRGDFEVRAALAINILREGMAR